MKDIKRLYVEKKEGFDVEAKELLQDFKENLLIKDLEKVRVINRYDICTIEEKVYTLAKTTVFSEGNVDNLWEEQLGLGEEFKAFGVQYLTGQFDQRADAAEQCIEIISEGVRPKIKYTKIIALKGSLNKDIIDKIKSYYINPVDSREVSLNEKPVFEDYKSNSEKIEYIEGFIEMNEEKIKLFHEKLNLAMTLEDLKMCKDYFVLEQRNPTYTEIAVIDTYWSDHCRHTTFSTNIKSIEIEHSLYSKPIEIALEEYMKSREFVYREERSITLMDIATIAMKEMKKRGLLKDLDESDEINACTIKVNIDTTEGMEEYLILFKNETHNHPTEIEPFGGAATCLGGAIRDPLSGRAYVYQAMRVTGSGDPRQRVEDTLKGKLPQRKITLGSAKGYSSYGNQIGLATGQVAELYDEGFVAKRMEIGAVIAAAPRKNVVREEPIKGDVVILLGGRTGRDGCGGATGSSKKHTENSIDSCGAEVQKGNAPTERKLQRLFRNPKVSTLIKRCNDFGAGGVSVAIGELCDGLDIDLDKVPKKYEGLTGTELAISESQERMAVVIDKEHMDEFIKLAMEENIEATKVAEVTDSNRLRMFFRGEAIVDISRNFLNTNGAKSFAEVLIKAPKVTDNYFKKHIEEKPIKDLWIDTLSRLNVCSQKGLVERFDSTIGAGTVIMPFGGKYQLTPAEGMVGKIPVEKGDTKAVTIMTYGYNPNIGKWSPFHGAFYSVIEAVTKVVALGGDYKNLRLTLQEYFEKLGKDKEKWGKPFASLLGALYVQKKLGIAAIGGKDSMSGSFEDLNVPPTLVTFAVALEESYGNIITQELKSPNSKLILINTKKTEDELIDFSSFKSNMEKIRELAVKKKILSAMSIKEGGLCESISKMCFGNKIGVKLERLNKEELFKVNYGSVVIEAEEDFNLEENLEGIDYKIIGCCQEKPYIEFMKESLSIDELIEAWRKPLSDIFKEEDKGKEGVIEEALFKETKIKKTIILNKKVTPRVFIPVFPGTNCEYDSIRAFENEGAEVKSLVFKNLNKELLKDSINEIVKSIKNSQIIMLPGGFSAGDEPEGSGKFIATVFRNPYIKEAIMELLKNRDGLMLGICNGFQALIKLGLVPYGEIRDIEEHMPTLTYNRIGKHMSSIVRTKVVSKLSPWLNEVALGEVHNIPISHGEGRFMASKEVIKKLIENGQIATQYVDLEGNIALNMPFNPNGSFYGIEGITSPDGRVFGKMGHSERIGKGLYKNVEGNMDQKLFKSGVSYFK